MSYTTASDFLALLRNTPGGERLSSMPGLDYLIAAMSRAGMFRLWVSHAAPTSNQEITVWLNPAQPSWSAEGVVWLWNAISEMYEVATPALWSVLLSQFGGRYVFQSVIGGNGNVGATTTMLAIQRNSPTLTQLTLPLIGDRDGVALQVVDFSTAIVEHTVRLIPIGGATIMRAASWDAFSTPAQLAGLTLHPSIDLNSWVIAP